MIWISIGMEVSRLSRPFATESPNSLSNAAVVALAENTGGSLFNRSKRYEKIGMISIAPFGIVCHSTLSEF